MPALANSPCRSTVWLFAGFLVLASTAAAAPPPRRFFHPYRNPSPLFLETAI